MNCPASIYAYHRFERAGYTHVRRYAGGIADWEHAGLPLERADPARHSAATLRGRKPHVSCHT